MCRRTVRPVFLPLALVRRDLERMSRADNDPFVPQPYVAAADIVDVVAGVAVEGMFGRLVTAHCVIVVASRSMRSNR